MVEYQPRMHEFLSLIPQDDKRKKNKQDFVKYVFFWYMVICESITAQVFVFHVKEERGTCYLASLSILES